MKIIKKMLLAVLALLLVSPVLLYLNSEVEPEVWQPAPDPGVRGVFAPNNKLEAMKLVVRNVGVGPEDITRGPDGLFYTGFEDGRIIRFNPDDDSHEDFANTGGRPLGMQFDASGNLIVADGYQGLLSIDPEGEIRVLVDSFQGQRMKFVDDLDIEQDGTIWFSDASQRFSEHELALDFIEASHTGRLFSYHPDSGELKLRVENLFFANGVALGPDDSFVLVNETGSSRIQRLWLKGEQAGQQELFYNGLAGTPDNLSFNGRDTFWVALPGLRVPEIDELADKPFIRKLVGGLPSGVVDMTASQAFFVGIGLDGKVKHNYQGPMSRFHTVTSVNEIDGKLYVGSLKMKSLGIIAAP